MSSVPLSAYDGPWTYAATWGFAMLLGNDRAASHHKKQLIRWDAHRQEWKVEDE